MDVLKYTVLVSTVVLVNCSRPSYSDCAVLCAANDICPTGTVCNHGFCESKNSDNGVSCSFNPDVAFGLIGHWPLDEFDGNIAFDAAGDNAGMLDGDPARVEGRYGGALQFNGTTDRVLLGDLVDFTTVGSISMAAWVRWDGEGSSTQNIIAQGFTDPAPGSELFLRVSREKERVEYQGGHFAPPSDVRRVRVFPVAVGEWVHLALTHDGGSWRFHLNGDEDRIAASNDEDWRLFDSSWAIGGRSGGGQRYFSGTIDDVRVYDRELTEDELRSLAGR